MIENVFAVTLYPEKTTVDISHWSFFQHMQASVHMCVYRIFFKELDYY